MVDLKRHEKETLFPTATGEKEPFPSLHDPSSLELSVIVPAYNEELRSESQTGRQIDRKLSGSACSPRGARSGRADRWTESSLVVPAHNEGLEVGGQTDRKTDTGVKGG
jgi:hypothetical protein